MSSLSNNLAKIDGIEENYQLSFFKTFSFYQNFPFLDCNSVFLIFRCLPLNLDWQPKSYEGKCTKETLKLIEETKIKDFLQMCSNIE